MVGHRNEVGYPAASPRRSMAWADMVSDESEPESGGKLDIPLNAGSQSATEAAQGSSMPSHRGARGGQKRGGRGTRRGRGGGGSSEDRSESCKRWTVVSEGRSIGTSDKYAPIDVLSDEARWAADLTLMAEQLQSLVARAPPAIDRGRPQNSAVGTEASLQDVTTWECDVRSLHKLQEEVALLREEAVASDEHAKAESHQEAHLRAELEAETERAAASGSESQAACLATHLRLQAALAGVAQTLAASRDAAREAAIRARRRAAESELVLGELRTSLTEQASSEKAAHAEHERAVASCERVRALPALRARREKAKTIVKGIEADCEQLRNQAEALRSELDAPHKNSEKAEELEERVRRLERECRDLHEGCNPAQTAETSSGGALSASELAQSKVQNEHLLAEVREVRQARDEAAAAHHEFAINIAQLKCDLEVKCKRSATNTQQAAEKLMETVKLESEAFAERQAMTDLGEQISLLSRQQIDLRHQTEKVHEAIAEKRALLCMAEQSESATALELEKKCAQLKEENPHGVMSRCLNAARFKAKSDRALWPASQANVC